MSFNILSIGFPGAGKTSLFERWARGRFQNAYKPTLGIDFFPLTLEQDHQRTACMLWDASGEFRYQSLARTLYQRSDIILFMLDPTQDLQVQESNFLKEREIISAHVIPLLVISKSEKDKELTDKKLTDEKINNLKASLKILHHVSISASTGEGLQTLSKVVLRKLGMVKRENGYNVNFRKQLEKTFDIAIAAAKPSASDTQEHRISRENLSLGLVTLKKKTLEEYDAGEKSPYDAKIIAESACELSTITKDRMLTLEDIQRYRQNMRPYQTSFTWTQIFITIASITLGIFLGAMIGALTGPGAFVTAFVGASLGAKIGAGVGGAIVGSSFAFFSHQWKKSHNPTQTLFPQALNTYFSQETSQNKISPSCS